MVYTNCFNVRNIHSNYGTFKKVPCNPHIHANAQKVVNSLSDRELFQWERVGRHGSVKILKQINKK